MCPGHKSCRFSLGLKALKNSDLQKWLFVSLTSELPDNTLEGNPKVYQKGHKRYFFIEKMSSGNSDITFFDRRAWNTLEEFGVFWGAQWEFKMRSRKVYTTPPFKFFINVKFG